MDQPRPDAADSAITRSSTPGREAAPGGEVIAAAPPAPAAGRGAAPDAQPGAAPPPPRDLGRLGSRHEAERDGPGAVGSGTAPEPGFRTWGARGRRARVLFVGRGPRRPDGEDRPAAEILAAVTPGEKAPPVAGAHQVHSAVVLQAAEAGVCGEGDAVVTDEPGLAVSVVTADCVPVLIEAGGRVAAVHAGWRGLVAGVIPAALRRLEEGNPEPRGRWSAWIGPAIGGACCYEVGEEVARQVAAASSPRSVVRVPGRRAHVDLVEAARHQLAAAGVATTWRLRCTRCDGDSLWSYRRQGKGAGRNLAFIWREDPAAG